MKRGFLLLSIMAFSAGCAADAQKGSWDEALKDLRGDNMQMRSNFSKMTADDGDVSKSKLRN
jgi:hypothetical protein